MSVKQFKLPDPGEGLTEAEIVKWHVKVGDTVKVNDIVVEIETAKSLVELPVPFAGTVTELLVGEGDTVEVGTPIISVEDGRAGPAAAAPPAAEPAVAPGGDDAIEEGKIGGTTSTGRTAVLVGYGVKQTEAKRRARKGGDTPARSGMPQASAPAAARAQLPVKNPDEFVPHPDVSAGEYTARTPREPSAFIGSPDKRALDPRNVLGSTTPLSGHPIKGRPAGTGRALAKPPVRKYARDLGVDIDEVAGSGEGGVISRADVDAFASGAAAPPGGALRRQADGLEETTPAGPDWSARQAEHGLESRIQVKGVRKMTAQAMVQSAFTAPHVSEWITIDVTRTMELVARLRQDREFQDVKVTPLLILAKALCVAIRRNPGMNATWDEQAQEIVVKRYVNLGIAAATPRGLLVPNIKDAHRMGLHELAEAIGALTGTAREGRTQPAEMAGGTMTITNVGVFGVDSGTPIINPGEGAIVCFGAIRKQPWVVTDAEGNDELAIRHVTQLSVSFDHRLIDGELGSRFLSDVAAVLEDPSRGLVWS